MKPKSIRQGDWYYYNFLFFMEHILGYKLYQKIFGKQLAGLYDKISKYIQEMPEIRQVEEVDKNISRDEFLKLCYEPGLPKVFRGAASEWDAVKEWNPDFFEKKYGNEEIYLNDNVGLADQEFETLTLREYIKQFRAGTRKYMRFNDLVNHHEELKDDFDMNWIRKYYLPFSWGEDTKMFMGAKGTLTPLHVGFSDFLFVQVMGRKKWIMYPTNNRIFLDARTERTLHFYSKANPYKTDDPQFPLLKYAQPFEVYLEPGDVLWVPSLVWHHVENLDDSIGIRNGHSSIPSAFKSSKMFTLLTFLATKPNLIAQAITTRTQKRSLVFLKSRDELETTFWQKLNPFRKK